MKYARMPIEIEAPEQLGYDQIECNLTESSFRDLKFSELEINLNELVLCYGDHRGFSGLREQITQEYGLHPESCLTTVGAASALYIIATSLLESGDEILVMKPNYGTNIETPRILGANVKYIDLNFEHHFKINLEKLKSQMTKHTKLVSITQPHNPTGVMLTENELKEIVSLCEKVGAYLLVDETYREMSFSQPTTLGALISERIISVSSLSKTYGLPGIRLGWILTQDKKLQELFLAAKEQIFICHSLLDEMVAYHFYLNKRRSYLQKHRQQIESHFQLVKSWIQKEQRIGWVEPQGGVVCFPRMKIDDSHKWEMFYQILNNKYKTYVGPGHWFEMPKNYMRIGFGWPTTGELQEGLKRISLALDELS
jgi:aspartate/methionine/tyrosine aminotransferase